MTSFSAAEDFDGLLRFLLVLAFLFLFFFFEVLVETQPSPAALSEDEVEEGLAAAARSEDFDCFASFALRLGNCIFISGLTLPMRRCPLLVS